MARWQVPVLVVTLVGITGVALSRPPPRGLRVHAGGPIALVDCTATPPADNRVTVTASGPWRTIESNAVPEGPIGPFPNDGNPNALRAQRDVWRVPTAPVGPGRAFDLGVFGVALDGVPFDPGAAEFWHGDRRSGWQYDALGGGVALGVDCNRAHVQPSGRYHYHGIPDALVERLGGDHAMVRLGWAADGNPIYARWIQDGPDAPAVQARSSWRLKDGERPGGGQPGGRPDGTFVQDWEYVPGTGDLDACNARVGWTPEQGVTRYYVLTDTFPYVPRCWVNTPDPSFERPPPLW